MPHTVSVTTFARRLADHLNRVAYRGESFVLVRGGQRLAEIRPLPRGRRLSELPGLLAGLPHLARGDAARFADDLDAARSELARAELRDPWRS